MKIFHCFRFYRSQMGEIFECTSRAQTNIEIFKKVKRLTIIFKAWRCRELTPNTQTYIHITIIGCITLLCDHMLDEAQCLTDRNMPSFFFIFCFLNKKNTILNPRETKKKYNLSINHLINNILRLARKKNWFNCIYFLHEYQVEKKGLKTSEN